MNKKPPDKIVVVKCPLKKILKNPDDKLKIFDVCFRTNKLVIHTYQFLRLWILNKYTNNEIIPEITKDTIKMTFKCLILETRGPKSKGENLILLNEFNEFYKNHYKENGLISKIDGSHLSQILEYMSTDMITNIENNIKMNFFKYVNRFVNSSFKKINSDLIENAEKKDKFELRKKLNKDIYLIKQDFLNNTLNSDSKYHEWIKTHKSNIFPKDFKNSYTFDVENNPQKYIKSMIYMCSEIEKIGTKLFQFFPLRTDIILKNIQLDTKSLIEIFVKKDKNKYLKDIESNKDEIWNSIFNLNNPVFKQSNYIFNYSINTDCYSVSIHMLNKSNVKEEQNKKINKKNKKQTNKIKTKDMTVEEKKIFKENEKTIQKNKDIEYKLKLKEKKDKEKEEYKKLSKEEQEKLRKKWKNDKKERQIKNKTECKYIDDLNDEELKELKNKNWVVIDVGIRVPLYMKDKKNVCYRYSNRKYANETKRFKYRQYFEKYKNKNGITEVEKKLSNYNSKTVNIVKFKEYILNKNNVNEELFSKYNEEIFRKYKWYGHLNKKKADVKLVKDLKKTYGKDAIMILGDASLKGNCKKGNISTPSSRYKKILMKNFKLYNIDEYNTSKIHYKTEEECKNFYHIDNNKTKEKRKMRKIHAVLTYKMEHKKSGCINRDNNAVNNMIKIVNNQIEKKERPLKYKRGTIKDANTPIK
jgi:hypothetical protein